MDKVYKAFGPDSWRYALEHVDKAVNTAVPSLNRLNLIYNTKDADMALFIKHFLGYYLMVERYMPERLESSSCVILRISDIAI